MPIKQQGATGPASATESKRTVLGDSAIAFQLTEPVSHLMEA